LFVEPLLNGGVGVAVRRDVAQDAVTIRVGTGSHCFDGSCGTSSEQVVEVVAESPAQAVSSDRPTGSGPRSVIRTDRTWPGAA
jgi:hypothetical protein